jgi:hypothetical protein
MKGAALDIPFAPLTVRQSLLPRSAGRLAVTLVATVAAVAAGCGRGTQNTEQQAAAPSFSLSLQPMPLPAQGISMTPYLTVSDRGVLASWIERAEDTATLRFSERTTSGWSPARSVASGGNWFLSWADAPSVLRLSDGSLVADWFVTTRAEIEAYDLVMSHSKDDGRTWAPSFKPHRDKTMTQHGFGTLFELPGHGVGLVWLDGRDMENNTTHPEGGVMMLRFTSFDASWKQSADVVVNERVCECCQTAAVVTPDGVLTAFRDRSEKEIRDIAVSRLESGAWSSPQVVHADNWEVFVCPVNGPALSARGRNVAAAWFTVKGDQGQAYAAFSQDAGRTWTAPVRLDEQQSVGHVDIELLDDGAAVATWVEFANQRQQFMMRRVDASGGTSAPIVIAGTGNGRVTGYPRLARHGDELVFVWTESVESGESGATEIKGAVARLPR